MHLLSAVSCAVQHAALGSPRFDAVASLPSTPPDSNKRSRRTLCAGAEFAQPADYSYWTVASPSCHDVSPLRAWYEEDAGRRERFYYRCLEGAAPVGP